MAGNIFERVGENIYQQQSATFPPLTQLWPNILWNEYFEINTLNYIFWNILWNEYFKYTLKQSQTPLWNILKYIYNIWNIWKYLSAVQRWQNSASATLQNVEVVV